MNLRRLFQFNKTDKANNPINPNENLADQQTESGNRGELIYLDNFANQDMSLSKQSFTDRGLNEPNEKKYTPLISEVKSFLSQNFFGLGKHNGAKFRSQEALELGMNEIVAGFNNAIIEIMEARRSKLHKLESEAIKIESLCATTTKRLRLACDHVSQEILSLESQLEQASQRQGWVLDALSKYQMGFHQGMREAIEFELIAD